MWTERYAPPVTACSELGHAVAWFAARYGVPVYVPQRLAWVLVRQSQARLVRVANRLPESPLRLVDVSGAGVLGWWREYAVWWPDHRALVCGDALGTASYFVRPGERLAVHPLRRLSPPAVLLSPGLAPERIFVGHGQGVAGGAAEALAHAIGTARPELAAAWRHAMGATWRRKSR